MLKDVTGAVKGNKTLMIIIGVLVIAAIIAVAYKFFKAYKTGTETAGDIAGGAIIETQTGVSIPRQTVCNSAAQSCADAIYRIVFTGIIFMVTDSDIITALNRLQTSAEAKLTSEFFKQKTGDSLKVIVEGGFLTDSSRSKINSVIRENLV